MYSSPNVRPRRAAWFVPRLMVGLAAISMVLTGHAAAASDDGSRASWTGTFDEQDWRRSFGLVPSGQARNVAPVNPPFASDGKTLRVVVPGSSDQRSRRGVEFRSPFRELGLRSAEAATLRYDVYVPERFDFVKGGKLPGLSGVMPGDSIWRSASSNDNRHDPRQWSGRIMWTAASGITSYLNVVRAVGREHTANRSSGRMYSISPKWKRAGEALQLRHGWNTIELYYRMNTPGRDDGLHRGWLNGRLGIDLDDVQYRTSAHPDLDINQLNFAVFFGGPKGPRTTQTLYFDNVSITRG